MFKQNSTNSKIVIWSIITFFMMQAFVFFTNSVAEDYLLANRTSGLAPLRVNFKLDGEKWSYQEEWNFGDGTVKVEKDPVYVYKKPGRYDVTVKYLNENGNFVMSKKGFITVYQPSGLARLSFVQGSNTWPGEGWENAIDSDIDGIDGTVSIIENPGYGIFKFSDEQVKKIYKIRFLTDSGIQNNYYQVNRFKVEVSENSLNDEDFVELGKMNTVNNDWVDLSVGGVPAKYIKVTCEKDNLPQMQFSEFEVYTEFVAIDSTRSYVVASTPHMANGVEQAVIRLVLKDQAGNPVTGKTLGDVDFLISGQNNYLTNFREAQDGVYMAYLSSLTAETKEISCFVNGIPVTYTAAYNQNIASAPKVQTATEFKQPEVQLGRFRVIKASETWPNENWEKAFDNNFGGANSFTSATGEPPSVLLEFVDQNVQWINMFRIKTKADVEREWRTHWVKQVKLLVSTTGMEEGDFLEVIDEPVLSGDWVEFPFPAVAARYIKVEIVKSTKQQWSQVAEIQMNTVPAPTPVELALFDVKNKETKVEVNWVTSSESNNYGFEIHRRSGRNSYEVIGFIPGNGTTNEMHRYQFLDEKLEPGKYYYRLKQVDLDGSFSLSVEKNITIMGAKKYELSQNFPNPFNPETTIQYYTGEAGDVSITIHNMLGQEITKLVNKYHEVGTHRVVWNGTNQDGSAVASGRYLFKISANDFQEVKSMTLIR
ncbi:PKD domain-containing protein [candidate division KSB1 bacterium]|nr:PKD domain-containing protein [candidate division KSB1 bacterium]